MKKIHVILGALFLTSACALSDIGKLNADFLNPLNDVLFANEFQVNDPQYLFDAINQTVTIRSKTAGDSVNGIYQLKLVANPASDQGIYRLIGTKGYNNLFLGIQYSSRGAGNFGARIVVQNSEITARDALNAMTTTPYVNSSTLSYGYYRASTAGTWARVSGTGIYNSAISEHFTFNFNEAVDNGVDNETHTLLYVNISGAVTNTSTYQLVFISNVSSSSVIYFMTSTDATAPLQSRYVGVNISSISNGVLRGRIVTSTASTTIGETETLTFASLFANTTTTNYTTLSSVERPDALLEPLRTKGPWVYVRGAVYDQRNTTNWDFSLQDQSVTITAFGSEAGANANVPVDYSLQTTSVSSVFRLVSTNGALNNKYFTFKFRIPPTETTIELASFYLEDSLEAAVARLNGASFSDNYVNIYSATLLGNGGSFVQHSLRLPTTVNPFTDFNNTAGISGALFGATVFTRSESGIEYIYVLGGAPTAAALSSTGGVSDGMYEISPLTLSHQLRVELSRTPDFGVTWESINFAIVNSTNMAPPFAGQTAWVGNRLFVYNSAKYGTLPTTESPQGINVNYRIISTTNFAGQWDTASLPVDLTNRPHASFFSSQGILTLVGGLHYNGGSSYTITNDVWQSYNGGSSWAQVAKTSVFPPRYMATVLTIGSEVFLLGGYTTDNAAGSFSDEVWKSTDSGLTWTKLATPIPAVVKNSYSSRSYGRMNGFVVNNALYIVAANTTVETGLTSPVAIYSSKDGGQSWTEETLVDAVSGAYNPTHSRAGNVIGSSYVWSANNTSIKGALFNIGGLDQGFATLSHRSFTRVLTNQ